jgi:hypothetical protein
MGPNADKSGPEKQDDHDESVCVNSFDRHDGFIIGSLLDEWIRKIKKMLVMMISIEPIYEKETRIFSINLFKIDDIQKLLNYLLKIRSII